MAEVTGAIHSLHLFDVADTIQLPALRDHLGPRATLATLYDKASGTPRVRYIQPPVIVDGDALGEAQIDGFGVRVKLYDYGVVSIGLSRAFSGSWTDLVAIGQDLIENDALQQRADDACRRMVDRLRRFLLGARPGFLDEDYVVFAVHEVSPPLDAAGLVERHGREIAQLLRGERQLLSPQEREETLRHRLSYLAEDVVIPAWNAAFLFDSEPAAGAMLEILEFANSQLLEFRYHDERLEGALGRFYGDLQHPRWTDRLIGRRYLRATRDLHSLLIDVNELTDRTENALKLVGDVYSARLFNLVAARLGLDQWKHNVNDKLKTLDDLYRFAVDQTRVSQGNILELVIVAILVFELVLSLKGVIAP